MNILNISQVKIETLFKICQIFFLQLLSFWRDMYLQKLSTKTLDKFITTTFARAPKAACFIL